MEGLRDDNWLAVDCQSHRYRCHAQQSKGSPLKQPRWLYHLQQHPTFVLPSMVPCCPLTVGARKVSLTCKIDRLLVRIAHLESADSPDALSTYFLRGRHDCKK